MRNKFLLTSNRLKIRFDQKVKLVAFEDGDPVQLLQPQRKNGFCLKLQRPWDLIWL